MPELWMPGATRIPLGNTGACNSAAGAKAIAHITWDRNATKDNPKDLVPHGKLVSYFGGSGQGVAPHILWDPFTGELTQFFPANSRSLSLKNDSVFLLQTNRAGSVVLQFEAVFFPYCVVNGKTYASLDDTPCRGWTEIQAWTKSWGVHQDWPGGRPTSFTRDTLSVSEYANATGWVGHNQVPGNDHTDPGSWPAFTSAVKRIPPAFPGRTFFKVGAVNDYVTKVDRNLIRLGFTKHNDGNGYQAGPRYTSYTRENVRDFQKSRGWTGTGADGLVGPKTWYDLFTL